MGTHALDGLLLMMVDQEAYAPDTGPVPFSPFSAVARTIAEVILGKMGIDVGKLRKRHHKGGRDWRDPGPDVEWAKVLPDMSFDEILGL
jgi:hypothetical protein